MAVPPAPAATASVTPSTIGHCPRAVPASPINGLTASKRSITASVFNTEPPAVKACVRSQAPGSRNNASGATIARYPLGSAAAKMPSAAANASTPAATVGSSPRIPDRTRRVASAGNADSKNVMTPSVSGAGHKAIDWLAAAAVGNNSSAEHGDELIRTAAEFGLAAPTVMLPVGFRDPNSVTEICHGSTPVELDACSDIRRWARLTPITAGPDVMVIESAVRTAPGTRADSAVPIARRADVVEMADVTNVFGSWSRWDSASGMSPAVVLSPMPSNSAITAAAGDVGSTVLSRLNTAARTTRASGKKGRSSLVPLTTAFGLTTTRSRQAPSADTSCRTTSAVLVAPTPNPTSIDTSTIRTSTGMPPLTGTEPGPPMSQPPVSAIDRLMRTRGETAAWPTSKALPASPMSIEPDTSMP